MGQDGDKGERQDGDKGQGQTSGRLSENGEVQHF